MNVRIKGGASFGTHKPKSTTPDHVHTSKRLVEQQTEETKIRTIIYTRFSDILEPNKAHESPNESPDHPGKENCQMLSTGKKELN